LKADLKNAVKSCRACHLSKHRLTRRQAKVIEWHPPARFHTVVMDTTEKFPASVRGHKKELVIGDLFTRFVIAIPIKDEAASTIATILFERWISVFGPPVRLVSDQGKPLVSAVVRHLCVRIGTNKIETSAYHPQTDGFVERYNRTLCEDIAKFVMNEENWDVLVPLATFRYNCSRNSATGVSPYSAMFGMDALEFDAALGLELRIDDEPEDLSSTMAKIHADLMSTGLHSRDVAATYYDRAVKECKYEVGDRVLLYQSQGAMEQGRKLRVPWLGPYRVVARQSSVGYTIKSEMSELEARVHVNRLRMIADDTDLSDVNQPKSGIWPDTKLILRSILSRKENDRGAEYQVRRRGRNGFISVPDIAIPDVVWICSA
jgi:Integrase core domain